MKKTIKSFIIALIVTLATVFSLCFTACYEESDGTINLNIRHNIYDYDKKTETSSDTPNASSHIRVGQYYKVVFDITCDDLKASIQNDEVSIKMTVQMGIYENDINKTKLLQSSAQSYGGLGFDPEQNETGIWVATFTVSKAGLPDFSKCGFIICLPSMKGTLDYEKMKVKFETVGKDKGHKISINGMGEDPETDETNPYVVSLLHLPGILEFSQDNISTAKDGLNAISIKVPSNCVGIKVEIFYTDEKGDKGSCGTKTYSYVELDGINTIEYQIVDFTELMIESLGNETRYYQWLDENKNPTLQVELTANGGSNYETKILEYEQKLRG